MFTSQGCKTLYTFALIFSDMSQEEPQATETTGHNGKEGTTGSSTPPPSILHRIMALLRPLAIERFRIIDLADAEQTITGIKKDIEFRGFNLWILVFSIIICSIGLNVNSTAVVIGAMLISPLMGPIMGIGLGLGTNDASTFKTAMANLGIAVGISILTSALYFAFSPINEASSELLSRTQPTLLDVVVALFGGLAGILAGSRKEKSNVIPGVAIATALMPPLCTAGYGLANGEWNFLAGGFYLFSHQYRPDCAVHLAGCALLAVSHSALCRACPGTQVQAPLCPPFPRTSRPFWLHFLQHRSGEPGKRRLATVCPGQHGDSRQHG